MKLVRNTGNDRVVDLIRPLWARTRLEASSVHSCPCLRSPSSSEDLDRLTRCRLVLGRDPTLSAFWDRMRTARGATDFRVDGLRPNWRVGLPARRTSGERSSQFRSPRLSSTANLVPQRGPWSVPSRSRTDGLGLTPGNPLCLIQASETSEEAGIVADWFDAQWRALPEDPGAQAAVIEALKAIASHRDPFLVYTLILHHLFPHAATNSTKSASSSPRPASATPWSGRSSSSSSATASSARSTSSNRFGGCIIADSVGLGKTFEALAIIKYHELRNDRVLVLCPSACATTGRSTRPTTAATSWPPTASTTTS